MAQKSLGGAKITSILLEQCLPWCPFMFLGTLLPWVMINVTGIDYTECSTSGEKYRSAPDRIPALQEFEWVVSRDYQHGARGKSLECDSCQGICITK